MLLEGKNAIITGSASGIGLATLKLFAENGANIWAFARKISSDFEETINQLIEKNHIWIKPVYADLSNEEELKKAFIEIRKEKVDILVNNAGTTYDALLPMISAKKAKDLFDVNFFAQLQVTQFVSRMMQRQRSGVIVFTGSYLGIDGNRGQIAYSSTKAAVHGMVKALAKELVVDGIRVNAVAPGVVDTKLLNSMTREEYDEAINKCGMKRAARPSEIANMIMVLSSDLSSYVTGQIIRVDGGMN